MSRKIVRLTLDNLEALPAPCRSCLFWERDPVRRSRVEDPAAEKDAWVSHVLREWGSCGRVALVDDVPVGLHDLRAGGVRARAPRASRPRRSRRTRSCSPRRTSHPSTPAAGWAGCWCRGWPAT